MIDKSRAAWLKAAGLLVGGYVGWWAMTLAACKLMGWL